jgi:hypothetical protein
MRPRSNQETLYTFLLIACFELIMNACMSCKTIFSMATLDSLLLKILQRVLILEHSNVCYYRVNHAISRIDSIGRSFTQIDVVYQ